MTKVKGEYLRVLVDGVPIAGATSFTYDGDITLLNASDKTSAGWRVKEYGDRGATVTVDALYDPAGTFSAEEIVDMLINRTSITTLEVAQIEGVGGGNVWRFAAKLSSFSLTGTNNELSTLRAVFESSGPITKGTVPTS